VMAKMQGRNSFRKLASASNTVLSMFRDNTTFYEEIPKGQIARYDRAGPSGPHITQERILLHPLDCIPILLLMVLLTKNIYRTTTMILLCRSM